MTTELRGDRVVDGAYRALPDPVSDRLLSLVLSLAAEVWTTRDRLRLVESALERHGLPVSQLVEGHRDAPEELDAMRRDRDAFVERLFATIADPAPRK